MWTLHPKHKMANSGLLFHRTLFDRKYPPRLNDFFWRVIENKKPVDEGMCMVDSTEFLYNDLQITVMIPNNMGNPQAII